MKDVRSTRDLYAEGLTSHQLARRVASGELVRIRQGAYARPGRLTPEEAHRRLVLATLPELGADAVASHASAAIMLGLPVQPGMLRRVHVTRRAALHGRSRSDLVQTKALLTDEEIVLIDGVACTSPSRTALDLCLASPFEWAVSACDAVLHRQLVDADEVAAVFARARGRPGGVGAGVDQPGPDSPAGVAGA